MMSIGPRTFVRFYEDSKIASYSATCDVGPSEMVDTVLLKQNIDLPIIAKGNSGIPWFKEGKIVYSGKPEIMSGYALMAFAAGPKIISGCCVQRLDIFERCKTQKKAHFGRIFRR